MTLKICHGLGIQKIMHVSLGHFIKHILIHFRRGSLCIDFYSKFCSLLKHIISHIKWVMLLVFFLKKHILKVGLKIF